MVLKLNGERRFKLNYDILKIIYQEHEVNISFLAKKTDLTHSAMSRKVDLMIYNDLLFSKIKGRNKFLQITPKGLILLNLFEELNKAKKELIRIKTRINNFTGLTRGNEYG